MCTRASHLPPPGRGSLLILGLLLLGSFVAPSAEADGKFFVFDETPTGVPYQRALLIHDGTRELLLLQSEYRISPSTTEQDIAWVVPVPAVPSMGSISSESAQEFFQFLAYESNAKVTRVSGILSPILFLVALPLGIGGWLLLLINLIGGRPQWLRARRAFLALLSSMFLVVAYLAMFSAVNSVPGVEVLAHEQVGVYDIHVIKGADGRAVIAWLDEGGFFFAEKDSVIFDRYVDQGWLFAAARVRSDSLEPGVSLHSEGLVAPIILSFDANDPVYPLALTATTGRPTELLLYVAAPTKVTCEGRLAMRYAGRAPIHLFKTLIADVDPHGLPLPEFSTLQRITKFTGTMTAADMAEDLVFAPAADNDPMREKHIIW